MKGAQAILMLMMMMIFLGLKNAKRTERNKMLQLMMMVKIRREEEEEEESWERGEEMMGRDTFKLLKSNADQILLLFFLLLFGIFWFSKSQ